MPSFRPSKSLIFILLTFIVSWPMAFVYFALTAGTQQQVSRTVISVVYMFIPGVCAVITQKLTSGGPVWQPLGITLRFNLWFIIGWFFPVFLAIAATAASLSLPDVQLARDPAESRAFESWTNTLPQPQIEQMKHAMTQSSIHPFVLCLIGGLIAGVTVNGLAGLGEELGWRGLLQREWAPLGFWKSSIAIGVIWGIWHLPFIVHGHNYPGHPIAGIFLMILWTTLLSPIIGYIRLRADTVLAAAVFHGALNGTAIAPAFVVRGGSSLTVGVVGLAGMLVLLLCNGGLMLLVRNGKRIY